ncbi:type IV pilus biogenesis protein PilP [Collimonas humicola]|uniref:type IV pilus biogenesis protein PilP n=1 Tax=Collimonas humicola TaxID=2825886 RepID=UPI001B8C20DA|nr:type IV pilus biogenesis protein PilP [Collimonas humicola]
MQNYLKHVVFFSGVLLSAAALAESASNDLTKIEAETLVLKARERQLDVQAKIIARQSEIAGKQAETERITQSAVLGNPVILSIEGLGGKMFATLKMENGTTLDVQGGDVLSNGMKVVSIRPNEVIIESARKKRTRLAPATHSAVAFDASYPSPGLNFPPLAPPLSLKGNGK